MPQLEATTSAPLDVRDVYVHPSPSPWIGIQPDWDAFDNLRQANLIVNDPRSSE
jgi:hypothetical protein